MNFGGLEAVALGRIRGICEQLAEAGLMHFKPLPGGPNGQFVGMSKITGYGCDVVDGLATSRIALDAPQLSQFDPTASATALEARAEVVEGCSVDPRSSDAPETSDASEILILKPTLWGVGVDLKEAYRRIRRKWVQRNA
jgi:hypothetical protein